MPDLLNHLPSAINLADAACPPWIEVLWTLLGECGTILTSIANDSAQDRAPKSHNAMTDDRFQFGDNWSRFLQVVDEERIEAAVESLRNMLGVETLDGQRFLDVGSGSGLFSLAAHRLGAIVHSFDYDPQSVACTQEMKRRFASVSPAWTVEQGSALDEAYLNRLETADLVYSWGVLHHTGDMWTAIDLVSRRVKPGGRFWLAIYNDQGQTTGRWIQVKQFYQRLPKWLRPLLCAGIGAMMLAQRVCASIVSFFVRLLLLRNPLSPLSTLVKDVNKKDARGMHRWYDLVDWVGGWPFEVARPEEVFKFLKDRGFALSDLKTCGGGMGCNEFLFHRPRSTNDGR